MPDPKDILFGAEAHRLGFVSRSRLLAVLAEVRAGAASSVRSALEEHGDLDRARSAAVQAMAAAALARASNDAGRAVRESVGDAEFADALLAPEPGAATLIPGEPGLPAPVHVAPADRYRLGRELGHGGIGRVLSALDTALDRDVAIKVILDGLPESLSRRFGREARLTARLEHPNIVPVHDYGELPEEGGQRRLFLCMKRIRGRDLGKVLRALGRGEPDALRQWTRPLLLKVFQDICLAIAYAHDRGVVHRDLKPSNVMLGDFGETLVVDWGLAVEVHRRRHEEDAGPAAESAPELTMDGALIGTPAYMAPEQAEGRIRDVDELSDVYSLGVILYEILTLRSPYSGESVDAILSQVRSGAIPPPSSVVTPPPAGVPIAGSPAAPSVFRAVPPELEAICLRALARRREDRYPSARALHDDVQLFLEGVKERERKAEEARAHVAAARGHAERLEQLRAEWAAGRSELMRVGEAIPTWATEGEKRPMWDLRRRLSELQEARVDCYFRAMAACGQALEAEPGLAEAEDLRGRVLLGCVEDAERRGEVEEARLHRSMLVHVDRGGEWVRRLNAPGTVTLRAWRWRCRCLKPVRDPGWSVAIDEDVTIPWVNGEPRPGPLQLSDLPVPRIRLSPPGAVFGHGADCVREEVAGVEVRAARLVERDLRLRESEERVLGTTPLVDCPVPQGSWVLTVAPGAPFHGPVRVPLVVTRGGAQAHEVVLLEADEVPPGMSSVAGGSWPAGGSRDFDEDPFFVTTRQFWMSERHVTCREYLEFLNDLASRGRLDEARRRVPRSDGGVVHVVETGGRFALPPPGALLDNPEFPIVNLAWVDAVAYAAWRGTREGRVYRLPHEQELERAVRGSDRRDYPWGNTHEYAFSNIRGSRKDGVRLVPAGSMPDDRSVFGIYDLAGNAASWGWNGVEQAERTWRSMRGSSYDGSPVYSSASYRLAAPMTVVRSTSGIRLAFSPWRQP